MDFSELAKTRYSCRNYSAKEIEPAVLESVLESTRMAPSACNRQPWMFYVVTSPDIKAKILSKSRPAFMEAPVVIAAVGLHNQAWHRPSDGKDHTDVDVSIAVEHLCLAAAESGLATCWVCSFDTEATKEALHLGEGEEPIALIPIGYAAPEDKAPAKTRKDMSEIVKYI